MEYKVGNYVFIWSLMRVGKIKSVRHNQDIVTLYVTVGKDEICMNAMTWSKDFYIKSGINKESKVSKCENIIFNLGLISSIVALYFILGK